MQLDPTTPRLHRAPAGRHLRRSARRRHAGRGSSGSARSSAATTTWRWAGSRPAAARARPTRGSRSPASPATPHDPPRHARVVGHVPAARAAGDHRRRRRPDVGRPGRARPRRRVVRRRAQAYGIPFPPSASGSTASRTSSRSSPACGTPRSARRSRTTARTAAGDRLTGAPQAGAGGRPADHHRRQAAPREHRRSRRATPPSSTYRSPRSSEFVERSASVSRRRAWRSIATRRPITLRRPRSSCAAAPTSAEVERRAAAIGREPDDLRQNGVGRHARRGRRDPPRVGRRRRRARSTCRCSTSPTSTTSTSSRARSPPASPDAGATESAIAVRQARGVVRSSTSCATVATCNPASSKT